VKFFLMGKQRRWQSGKGTLGQEQRKGRKLGRTDAGEECCKRGMQNRGFTKLRD